MAIRVGDIYAVEIEPDKVKLFHHVINDTTQLGGNVIRAFLPLYQIDSLPSPLEIVQAEVDFHAHTFCALGVKKGFWRKVAHSKLNSEVTIWFRNSADYGKPSIKVSKDWWVWRVNEPSIHVGALQGEYIKSEIGVIMPPSAIVERMKTGSFSFVYPTYE